ncbi:hypothetical protein RUMOBE_03911 [Blautia obeum ATCC 29174]|uniref:Uncharacterized protein n=1 Tax=Blautia obeum ATCC 29174 TaxID=411459 RepID=A5ZY05_9FIRM|nr:hypothetical protein RUMOBE_03911 [Blautia obeum ATCC 29174]
MICYSIFCSNENLFNLPFIYVFDWVYFTTELYMNKEAVYRKNKGTV